MIPLAEMLRSTFLCLFAATAALAQIEPPEPAFDRVQFEKWIEEGHNAHIRWSLRVSPPYLTELQRLQSAVFATVAGEEFVKRDKPGQMEFFLEIRDKDNRTYRSHRVLALRGTTRGADLARLALREDVCTAPGDYEVAAAVYDRLSKEHSLRRMTLRAELPHDPLPGAWSKLPTVALGGRACYQLPFSFPLETEKPVRIDAIANKPASPDPGVYPRIKIISQMEIQEGSITVTALDLHSRKVKTLTATRNLDERRLWAGFPKDDRNMVSVHALENDKEAAQFFVSEIRKLLERPVPEAQHALIILSERRSFPKGEDLRPIQATLPPGTRVFYVRCNSRPNVFMPPPDPAPPDAANLPMHPAIPSGPFPVPPGPSNRDDSLERMLAPLHPRLFDVTTALEFRSALAAIMSDISQQK